MPANAMEGIDEFVCCPYGLKETSDIFERAATNDFYDASRRWKDPKDRCDELLEEKFGIKAISIAPYFTLPLLYHFRRLFEKELSVMPGTIEECKQNLCDMNTTLGTIRSLHDIVPLTLPEGNVRFFFNLKHNYAEGKNVAEGRPSMFDLELKTISDWNSRRKLQKMQSLKPWTTETLESLIDRPDILPYRLYSSGSEHTFGYSILRKPIDGEEVEVEILDYAAQNSEMSYILVIKLMEELRKEFTRKLLINRIETSHV